MSQTITLQKSIWVAGVLQAAGATITVDDALAGALVHAGSAVYVTDPMAGSRTVPAMFGTDASGNVTGLVGPDGSAYFGPVASGVWMRVPSIFRLEMTGTGTVTLDSMDSLGNITSGVYSATLSSATNEIGFPYAGDAAVAIRATLTGSATAKVI